jgi:transposase InsO family protein
VQAELTVAMDWYTRCVTGIRLTPVSTKSVDAAATLYQAYRPRPAGKGWPAHVVWPEHGVPRSVLIDRSAITGPIVGAAGPAIVPETLVVDHGKDLCLGASNQRVQPAGDIDPACTAAHRERQGSGGTVLPNAA